MKALELVRRLAEDEDGAALLEYTVLLGILLVAVIATITLVGAWISGQRYIRLFRRSEPWPPWCRACHRASRENAGFPSEPYPGCHTERDPAGRASTQLFAG